MNNNDYKVWRSKERESNREKEKEKERERVSNKDLFGRKKGIYPKTIEERVLR